MTPLPVRIHLNPGPFARHSRPSWVGAGSPSGGTPGERRVAILFRRRRAPDRAVPRPYAGAPCPWSRRNPTALRTEPCGRPIPFSHRPSFRPFRRPGHQDYPPPWEAPGHAYCESKKHANEAQEEPLLPAFVLQSLARRSQPGESTRSLPGPSPLPRDSYRYCPRKRNLTSLTGAESWACGLHSFGTFLARKLPGRVGLCARGDPVRHRAL
jgi:hypothetical protein